MAPDGVGVVCVSSSIDRSVDCEIHPEDNEATVTVSREISVEDLFNDDGELRLWEDYAGWNGYFRDDDGLWEVNCQSENDEFLTERDDLGPRKVRPSDDDDRFLKKEPADAEAVAEAVADHVDDPEAGGVGVFARRCSPP